MTPDGALFAEPERVPERMDGPWLVGPGGWRYVLPDDDSETFLISGHVARDELPEVLALLPDFYGAIAADDVDPLSRWARLLTECPMHPPTARRDTCSLCRATRDAAVWDWGHPDGEPDAYRNVPGYLPVTVIELEV